MVCITGVEVRRFRIVDDAGEQAESVDSQECELRWDRKAGSSYTEHDACTLVNIEELSDFES